MFHDPILLQDYIERASKHFPEKEALNFEGQRLSFIEIEFRANRLAHRLIASGLRPSERVVLFLTNSPEWVISFWAVLKANGVVTLVNPQTKEDKLIYLMRDSRAAMMISENSLAPLCFKAATASKHLRKIFLADGNLEIPVAVYPCGVANLDDTEARAAAVTTLPKRVQLDIDLAAIIYTSGSTGDPKGVMLTHRNMISAAHSVSTYLNLVESDAVLCALPLSFDYGLYQIIMSSRVGARVVLERSFANPLLVLKTVVNEKVTVFPGVPTVFALMQDMRQVSSFDLSSVRTVTNTAAALSKKNIDYICATFPKARLFSMYGLTECKRCTYLPPEELERRPLSVGVAIPNTSLQVVDEQGNPLPAGQVGQLVIRGSTVMKGYWEKAEQSNKKLKPGQLPNEMLLYTGDLCRLDEDGFLYFVSRMDEVIKTRGEKVSPKEVEVVLLNIPGVRECAVIGVPDEVFGQAVKAFIVVNEGVTLNQKTVLDFARKHLERFAVPSLVEFVPSLPRTNTGKIKKTGLASGSEGVQPL